METTTESSAKTHFSFTSQQGRTTSCGVEGRGGADDAVTLGDSMHKRREARSWFPSILCPERMCRATVSCFGSSSQILGYFEAFLYRRDEFVVIVITTCSKLDLRSSNHRRARSPSETHPSNTLPRSCDRLHVEECARYSVVASSSYCLGRGTSSPCPTKHKAKQKLL